uniref:Shikimate dehydrogenase n=1 Tax=Rosa rugosa TaxID=74645 RepID=J7FY65_ROSRU|nr:shikimate dehydrogenase [Rosa rugosa]
MTFVFSCIQLASAIVWKSSNVASEPNSKHVSPKASSDHPDDERGTDKRNGVKARNNSFLVSERTSSFHLGSSSTVFMFQRVAISTAANMCKKLPSDATDFGMEAVPLLTIFCNIMDLQWVSAVDFMDTLHKFGWLSYSWYTLDSGIVPVPNFLWNLPYILHVYNFRLIRPDTRLYDVTGKPISNSKSPPLYNKEFKSVGFDEVYVNSFETRAWTRDYASVRHFQKKYKVSLAVLNEK